MFRPRQDVSIRPYNPSLERSIDSTLSFVESSPLNDQLSQYSWEERIIRILNFAKKTSVVNRGKSVSSKFVDINDKYSKKKESKKVPKGYLLCNGKIMRMKIDVGFITSSSSFIFDRNGFRGDFKKLKSTGNEFIILLKSRYHLEGEVYEADSRCECCSYCYDLFKYTTGLYNTAQKRMKCGILEAKKLLLDPKISISYLLRKHLYEKFFKSPVNIQVESVKPTTIKRFSKRGPKRHQRLSTSWKEAREFGEEKMIKQEIKSVKKEIIGILEEKMENGYAHFAIQELINEFTGPGFGIGIGKIPLLLKNDIDQMVHFKRVGYTVESWERFRKLLNLHCYNTINKTYGAFLQKCADSKDIFSCHDYGVFVPWKKSLFGLLDSVLIEEMTIEALYSLEKFNDILKSVKQDRCRQILRDIQLRKVNFNKETGNLFVRSYEKGGTDATKTGKPAARKEEKDFEKFDMMTFGHRDVLEPRKVHNFYVSYVSAMETNFKQFKRITNGLKYYLNEMYKTGFKITISEYRKKAFIQKAFKKAPNLCTKIGLTKIVDGKLKLFKGLKTITMSFDMKKVCDKVGGRVHVNNEEKIKNNITKRTWDYRTDFDCTKRYDEYSRPFQALHFEMDTCFRVLGYGKDNLAFDEYGNLVIRSEFVPLDSERDEILGLDPISQGRYDPMHETMAYLHPIIGLCRYKSIVWSVNAFPNNDEKRVMFQKKVDGYFTKLNLFGYSQDDDRGDTTAKKWKLIHHQNFLPTLHKFLVDTSESMGSNLLSSRIAKSSTLWKGFSLAVEIVGGICFEINRDGKKNIDDIINTTFRSDQFKLLIRAMRRIPDIETIPQYNAVNHCLRPLDRIVDGDEDDRFDTNELLNKNGVGEFTHTNQNKKHFATRNESYSCLDFQFGENMSFQQPLNNYQNTSSQLLMGYTFKLNPKNNFFIKKVYENDEEKKEKHIQVVDINEPERIKPKIVFVDSPMRNDDIFIKRDETHPLDYHKQISRLKETEITLCNWIEEMIKFRAGRETFLLKHTKNGVNFPDKMVNWLHPHQRIEIPKLWKSFVEHEDRGVLWTPSAGKAILIVYDSCGIMHTNKSRNQKELVLIITPKTAKEQMISEINQVCNRFDLRYFKTNVMKSNLPNYLIEEIYREECSVFILDHYNIATFLKRIILYLEDDENDQNYWNIERMLFSIFSRINRIHLDESSVVTKNKKLGLYKSLIELIRVLKICKQRTKEIVDPHFSIVYYSGSPSSVGNSCFFNTIQLVDPYNDEMLLCISRNMRKIKKNLDEIEIENTNEEELRQLMEEINSHLRDHPQISIVKRSQLDRLFNFENDVLTLFVEPSKIQKFYYCCLLDQIFQKKKERIKKKKEEKNKCVDEEEKEEEEEEEAEKEEEEAEKEEEEGEKELLLLSNDVNEKSEVLKDICVEEEKDEVEEMFSDENSDLFLTKSEVWENRKKYGWECKMIANKQSPRILTDVEVHRSKIFANMSHNELPLNENPKTELSLLLWEICQENTLRRTFFSKDTEVLKFQKTRIGRMVKLNNDPKKIRDFELTGKTPPGERNKIIEGFNKSDPPSNLYSTYKVGGIGMNIQGSSMSIGTDSLHLADENVQWVGRSRRYGRTTPILTLQILCCDDTVEEIVHDDGLKRGFVQQILVFDEKISFPNDYRNQSKDELKSIIMKYVNCENEIVMNKVQELVDKVRYFVDHNKVFKTISEMDTAEE